MKTDFMVLIRNFSGSEAQDTRPQAKEDAAARPALSFYLVSPVIYSMIVPAVLLDLFISVYQRVCFPVYGIATVQRKDYISFDRHRLRYLNLIQRINCDYCAYFNGVIAYAREVASRTEQFFCPIRHALRTKGLHSRHQNFLPYGDRNNVRSRMQKLRKDLSE